MEINITKKQEIVNDVPKTAEYNISIIQHFGSGDLKRTNSECLYNLSLEDILALRDRLNKDFPHD